MLLPRCCTPSARNFMRATRVNPVGRQWGTAAAAFSTSSLTLSAPIRVEGHPHLYLHPTSTKDRYALSFLSQPPLHPSSPTVLGIVSSTTVTPRTFEENPDWLQLLHEILSQTCWGDEALKTQAVNREEGYLHIIDGRNYPALNRAGEPEDIIASVLCKDGKLVEGEYQPGQAYRIVTANGPPQLPEGLRDSVMRGLELAASVEEEMMQEDNSGKV